MPKIGLFTIASKNYLSYVRTLLNSVKSTNPDYELYLCLADRVDNYFDAQSEHFITVQSDELGIQNFDDMTLRYDIMEFNTAVKPFMFKWLFDHTDLDIVIYLDPDIRVYGRFDLLESELERASVVLTPHITKPLEDGKTPNDYHMLQAGVFNLGFIATRRCKETLDFMEWWGRRLASQCVSEIENNLFVDQKWCDLAPCFIDNLAVFKNPGYNVAYWNLAQRHISMSLTGEWQVNGAPLTFFHFSGVNADKRNMVSKHQNRFDWKDIGNCQPLFESYYDELILNGWKETSTWPYAYTFGSKKNYDSLIRRLYRLANPIPINLKSKDIDLEKYAIELCNQKADEISDSDDIRVTCLMKLVYQQRPDVQAVFSLNSTNGRRQFVNWFEVAGEREYGLPANVTQQNLIKGTNSSSVSLKKN